MNAYQEEALQILEASLDGLEGTLIDRFPGGALYRSREGDVLSLLGITSIRDGETGEYWKWVYLSPRGGEGPFWEAFEMRRVIRPEEAPGD